MPNAIEQFRAALAVRGIVPDQIEADGELHRCPVEGSKSGKSAGSYVLHLDGLPAGGYENWKDGRGWQTWHAHLDHDLSHEERAVWHARVEALKKQRAADQHSRHYLAARRAKKLLTLTRPATNEHPYLLRKGVNAYGMRLLGRQLVIPLRDADGVLWSLQFITEDGVKRFLTGGRKSGCYFAIGRPRESLCICEGYATAASVFEATGHATAVAFDAGNLTPVAVALRRKFPRFDITICADNDSETPGNPGVSLAMAAARAINGRVAIPQFGGCQP